MSRSAKDKMSVSIDILIEREAYIVARGDALEWSRAQTINKIIEFWLALGARALSGPDAAKHPQPVPAEVRVPMIEAWAKYAGNRPPASLPVRG